MNGTFPEDVYLTSYSKTQGALCGLIQSMIILTSSINQMDSIELLILRIARQRSRSTYLIVGESSNL